MWELLFWVSGVRRGNVSGCNLFQLIILQLNQTQIVRHTSVADRRGQFFPCGFIGGAFYRILRPLLDNCDECGRGPVCGFLCVIGGFVIERLTDVAFNKAHLRGSIIKFSITSNRSYIRTLLALKVSTKYSNDYFSIIFQLLFTTFISRVKYGKVEQ
jgi:hypothetical protein